MGIPLTSIDFGYERVGFEAARRLHRLMDGKTLTREPRFLPVTGLVARASTDFHAVSDELVSTALRFISANCHRPIGQDEVAEAVFTSTRNLQKSIPKMLWPTGRRRDTTLANRTSQAGADGRRKVDERYRPRYRIRAPNANA